MTASDLPTGRQARDLDFIDWIDSHRNLAGTILLAFLGFGFWGISPLILDEWQRMDHWHRAAVWIGDLTAVTLVIPWMFSQAPNRAELLAAGLQKDDKRALKWAAAMLLLSLSADIGVTVHGIYCEKPASERSLEATATVVHVEPVAWQRRIAHYRLTVRFTSELGRTHQGLIVFTKKTDGYPDWVSFRTQREIEQGSAPFPIEIRYDPLRPARVWAKSEPWNRGNALGYVFALVHLFQGLLVGAISLVVLFSRDLDPLPGAARMLPMFAVAVQACAMAVVGLGYWIRGF